MTDDVDPIQFEVTHHADGSTTFDSHLEIHGAPAPANWKEVEPIKCSCSLCGADWEGHDHCPVERAWQLVTGALGFAIALLFAVSTCAVLWR